MQPTRMCARTHTHVCTQKKDYSVAGKDWQNMQQVDVSAHFVTTVTKHAAGGCFSTFCHHSDKTCSRWMFQHILSPQWQNMQEVHQIWHDITRCSCLVFLTSIWNSKHCCFLLFTRCMYTYVVIPLTVVICFFFLISYFSWFDHHFYSSTGTK